MTAMAKSSPHNPSTESEVAAYLRKTPDFLVRHSDVLDALLPPQRELGNGISDFQRFLVDRLKGQIEQLRESRDAMLAAGRLNELNIHRIHAAALRLSEARALEELAAIIRDEVPALCEIGVAMLALESAPDDLALPASLSRLSPGALERWLGPAEVLLQAYAQPQPEIFGKAAGQIRSLALIRLDLGAGQPQAVMAFGSGDPEWFTPDQATDLITFLAGIVSRRMQQLMP